MSELRAILLIAAHRATRPSRTYEMVRIARAAMGERVGESAIVCELIAMKEDGLLVRTVNGNADWFWSERCA